MSVCFLLPVVPIGVMVVQLREQAAEAKNRIRGLLREVSRGQWGGGADGRRVAGYGDGGWCLRYSAEGASGGNLGGGGWLG